MVSTDRTTATRLERLPLRFIENRGQADPGASFYLHGAGTSVSFTSDGLVFSVADQEGTSQRWGLGLDFVGASRVPPSGRAKVPGTFNFLTGERADWVTGVPSYSRVVYEELWPGIDLAYRNRRDVLKYSFRVAPGADPTRIRLAWRGASAVDLTDGGLEVATPAGTLADEAPVSYQASGGERASVPTAFSLRGNTFGFALGHYDRGQPLVIDPGVSLAYSTLLGGDDSDIGLAIAVDDAGARYIAAQTRSVAPPFPTTPGAFDTVPDPGYDAVVAKLDPSGNALEYSTFLGGGGNDAGVGIAVDGSGAAFVTGFTYDAATDFPTTPGAYDTSHNGGSGDAFVAKLNPAGTGLIYSTLLGGNGYDTGYGVDVDEAGAAYVSGSTDNALMAFPTTPGAYDPIHNGLSDAFVAKLDPSGSDLTYSTFLGGSSFDRAYGIAVDEAGAVFASGETTDAVTDFPTTPGGYDTSNNGLDDAFVAKLDPSGSDLTYSTFLGGSSDDRADEVAVDGVGAAYVTGTTADGATDLPTTALAFDTSHNGMDDTFVTKLDPAGSGLAYSTFLGGSDAEQAYGIAVDNLGVAYVTGETRDGATDFPTTPDAFDATQNGDSDAYVAVLSSLGSSLEYSTFLGGTAFDAGVGIALDRSAAVHVTGETEGAGFPTTPGAFDTSPNGDSDTFLTTLQTLYRCLKRPVTHLGSPGDDVLVGTQVGDVVLALGGKDVVRTRGGADRVCAGDGNDTVNAGAGKDRVLGELGRDRLKGGGGNDRLNGGKGKDLCSGGGGKDRAPACEKEKGIP